MKRKIFSDGVGLQCKLGLFLLFMFKSNGELTWPDTATPVSIQAWCSS